MGIRRRIPFVDVDPVHDADDLGVAKNAVEAEAELGRLDFLRVPRTDGGDDLRVRDGALQKTDASPVLEAIDGEQFPSEIEPRQPVGVEQPLILFFFKQKTAYELPK